MLAAQRIGLHWDQGLGMGEHLTDAARGRTALPEQETLGETGRQNQGLAGFPKFPHAPRRHPDWP